MTAPDAERFDALAPIYDQVVPFFGLLGERLVQWAGPTPGQRVLDLGAGRGAVTSALSRWMGPAAGIVAGDVSTEMLSQLRALELPGVTVKYLDATGLTSQTALLTSCSAPSCCISSPTGPGITEVVRVLRPTGTFVMSVPGPATTKAGGLRTARYSMSFAGVLSFPTRPRCQGSCGRNGGHRRAQDGGQGDGRGVHTSRWT